MSALFTLVNGKQASSLNLSDRAIHYGDGVFRTLAIHHGQVQLLKEHLDKLLADCRQLYIKPPSREILIQEIALSCSEISSDRAVLKVIVTRGVGKRGYQYEPEAEPTRILMVYPWHSYPDSYYQQGVRVRVCQTRLASNPLLAGAKHLNRLEQVLARGEWQDKSIAEGLMLDQQEHVISGTFSNLFLLKGQTLQTPDLSQCGIAGVMRQIILANAEKRQVVCQIRPITLSEVYAADAVFLTNSLIGVWPVQEIVGRTYSQAPMSFLANFFKPD